MQTYLLEIKPEFVNSYTLVMEGFGGSCPTKLTIVAASETEARQKAAHPARGEDWTPETEGGSWWLNSLFTTCERVATEN